jgi:phosphatidate cytidylyltransferase
MDWHDTDLLPQLPDEAWRLTAGIGAVLLLATLVGRLLRLRLAHGQGACRCSTISTTHRQLVADRHRRRPGVARRTARRRLLFALASLAALREFLAGNRSARDPARAALGASARPAAAVSAALRNAAGPLLFGSLIPLCVVLVVPASADAVRPSSGNRSLRIRPLQGGLLLCVHSASRTFPALLTLPGGADQRAQCLRLLVFLLLVVQVGDVLQYLWGKLAGRHPIAPRLSPAKDRRGHRRRHLSASALGAWLAPLTPFTTAGAAWSRCARRPRIPRRPAAVGAEAAARHQGLGHADSRSRRHARPARLALPVGAGLLLPAALSVGAPERNGELRRASAAAGDRAASRAADRRAGARPDIPDRLAPLRRAANW